MFTAIESKSFPSCVRCPLSIKSNVIKINRSVADFVLRAAIENKKAVLQSSAHSWFSNQLISSCYMGPASHMYLLLMLIIICQVMTPELSSVLLCAFLSKPIGMLLRVIIEHWQPEAVLHQIYCRYLYVI